MGRVVKNARVNSVRYAVPIPQVERSSDVVDDDDQAFFGSSEPQAYVPPAPAPVDYESVAGKARDIIDLAEQHANALLADAHERATQLLHEAANRAESLVAAVKAQAQADGHTAGTAAAEQEMSDMMATMRNVVDMARAERHQIMAGAEPELVRLAIGIAERVLHQQIALDRGVVVEMAKVAIARLVDRESVTVRVNPSDVERMKEHREEFLNSGDIKNFRVVEDQRVDRGGVVVETDGGTIDARIGTQLAEAKRVLHIEDDVIVKPADDHESNLRTARAS